MAARCGLCTGQPRGTCRTGVPMRQCRNFPAAGMLAGGA